MTWQDKAEELRGHGYPIEICALTEDANGNLWAARIPGLAKNHYAKTIEEAIEKLYEWFGDHAIPDIDDLYQSICDSDGTREVPYSIVIWGKTLFIRHYTDSYGEDDITISNEEFKYKCAKCNKKFDPRPTHGDKITCSKCGASYQFFGAGSPILKYHTRREVEQVLGIKDNSYMKKENKTQVDIPQAYFWTVLVTITITLILLAMR